MQEELWFTFRIPLAATGPAADANANNMVEDRRLLTRLGSPLRVVQLGGCDRVMASHGDVFPGVYYCQEKYSMDRWV